MKKGIILLLFGAVVGLMAWHYRERLVNPVSMAVEGKLTPDKMNEKLARTGRVVSSEARTVGERIDDARIVAVIKGKYIVDSDLSVFAISVDCRDGDVKLTGSVAAAEHISRAVTLARQAHGVRGVESLLMVKN